MTKLNYMLTMIDDTYDAYGTLEELILFTEAIRRWNIDAVDMLPEYMKFIYKTLLDVFNEIEDDLAKEGRSYCIPYAKDAEHKVIETYFVQAKWFNEGYVPSMEEYMPVALISCAYTLVITISFLGMGDIATRRLLNGCQISQRL
ncbi:Valencene synthase [Melia azedarach]|uniref:Valencene synthase n=1 Tax=Melia azedarach TaxID=155640 RepID=A0ACC1XPZ2_MELAZ|nr:Valencene synthase [Melia azedarach]